jgi:hypothetical protein
MDPLLPALVGIVFVILVLAVLLRRFRQPSIVAYLLTGIVLGPNGLGVVTDAQVVTRLGEIVGVLLVQDVAIIPMLMAIGFFAGDAPSTTTLIAQLMAGVGIIGLLGFVAKKEHVPLPIGKWLRNDKELQVLGAFAVAFGLAFLTGIAGLSTALGALVGGVVLGASRETEWIHDLVPVSRLSARRVLRFHRDDDRSRIPMGPIAYRLRRRDVESDRRIQLRTRCGGSPGRFDRGVRVPEHHRSDRPKPSRHAHLDRHRSPLGARSRLGSGVTRNSGDASRENVSVSPVVPLFYRTEPAARRRHDRLAGAT